MTILVIGGTGQVGSGVVGALAGSGAEIRVLSPRPDRASVPEGVGVVTGDVLDLASLRDALGGIDTLFVLNPVVADELTRALLTLRLATEAGVKGIVYFSMVNADTFADTPHAAAKYAAERMIARFELPATILRANCFYQNDAMVKEPLLADDRYVMPVGRTGVAMVDIRDIAEVAAGELLRRERASGPLPRETIEVSGPEVLSADGIVAIWSELLGRPISYAGDDTDPIEKQLAAHMPAAMAYDTALMFRGFHRDGMLPSPGAAERVAALLGRPLRTYRGFAEEMVAAWREA